MASPARGVHRCTNSPTADWSTARAQLPLVRVARLMARSEWEALEAAHQGRVDAATAAHLRRRGDGRRHPVEDFLFTYYSLKPAQLRRWHPGPGVRLEGAAGLPR